MAAASLPVSTALTKRRTSFSPILNLGSEGGLFSLNSGQNYSFCSAFDVLGRGTMRKFWSIEKAISILPAKGGIELVTEKMMNKGVSLAVDQIKPRIYISFIMN